MTDVTVMDTIRQQALRLLARREHSRHELQRKLVANGWGLQQIGVVLDELAADHLQDDARFLVAYIRYRSEAGYGPRRILAELAERGIRDVPDEFTDEYSDEWLAVLKRAWQKKFRGQSPRDFNIRAKQIRFLIYRGFAAEQVYTFLKEAEKS